MAHALSLSGFIAFNGTFNLYWTYGISAAIYNFTGTSVETVTATDADKGAAFNTLTYRIAGK